MKIYTEYDVKRCIQKALGSKAVCFSRYISENCGLNQDEMQILIRKINETYDLHIVVKEDISLNGLVEKMNQELGLNKLIIKDFFLEICNQNPKGNAIQFDEDIITYENLLDTVQKLANGLYMRGIRKGGKVAVILSNRVEYIFIYFALFYIGAYPIPINTRWAKEEVFNVLNDSKAEMIVTEEKIGSLSVGEYVEEYIRQNVHVHTVVYFEKNRYKDKGIAFGEILTEKEFFNEQEKVQPDDIAMLSYTSGTTGTPKGVMLKQNDIVKISAYTTQIWRNEEEEYPLSIAPLYSAQGFLSLFINFAIGKTFKMLSSFNPNDILKVISKGENTILHTQPTMWSLLLNCRIVNFTNFSSLKNLLYPGRFAARNWHEK